MKQEFNAVSAPSTNNTDYGQLSLYPPTNVPIAGDDGHACFQGQLSGQSYGNGIYNILTKRPAVEGGPMSGQNADSRYDANGTWKIQTLMDRNTSTNVWMEYNNNRRDIYFNYEFPEQIYIRKVEVYLNNTTSCQVDVWNNQEPYYANQNSSWNSNYNGSIEYKNTNTDPAIVTMDDHNYKSTNIRVRLYDLYPGILYIQPRQISFKVTF